MKNKIILALIVLVVLAGLAGVLYNYNNTTATPDIATPAIVTAVTLTYKVINTLPHDSTAYTEGYELYNGMLYESAGEQGKSRVVQYKNGSTTALNNIKKNDDKTFAEGITILRDTLYQLTYRNNVVHLYNPTTLQPIGTRPWIGAEIEGWGLTNNGTQLIASTGTNVLYYLNPNTMAITKTINVMLNGQPLNQVNELEYVNGYIYANVFTTDMFIKIDAETGNVLAQADLSTLLPAYNAAAISQASAPRNESFVNGIAYNKATNTFFVTGKNWPKVYELQLQ